MSRPTSCISLVIPVFNEEKILSELFARLTALFDAQPAKRGSAVLAHDGSRVFAVGISYYGRIYAEGKKDRLARRFPCDLRHLEIQSELTGGNLS